MPRTIQTIKALKYSETFQITKQYQSFQGIDMFSIINLGHVKLTSRIFDIFKSYQIACQPDINLLQLKLQKESCLSTVTVNTTQIT